MTSKKRMREMRREYCAEVGEDHGMILRDDQQGDVNERKQSRKSRQLCRQVAEALDWVLSGDSHDELLQSLRVADVQPAPYSSRLLVTVITDMPAEEADRTVHPGSVAGTRRPAPFRGCRVDQPAESPKLGLSGYR